jgi:hypothetical protein
VDSLIFAGKQMSRLVHFGPRAARSAGAAVQAVPRRAFSDTPTEDAAAKSGASPAAEPAEDFKISRHSIDARKSQTQITDEALARSSLGGRVERLRSYTGVPNWSATTDPVMRETMRRTETEAATKDEKKKAVWNRILSSNEPTDKKYVPPPAPSLFRLRDCSLFPPLSQLAVF